MMADLSWLARSHSCGAVSAQGHDRFMRIITFLLALVIPGTAPAQTILADIPPVASLVAQVTEGIETPGLIGQGISDPHGGSLRPSDARALSRAQVVFWIGPILSPWLEGPLDQLAGDAVVVALSDAPGVVDRPFREEAVFDAHDGHAHDDDHDHSGDDPHLWLDPVNARAFLAEISRVLSKTDPENADAYAANAKAASHRLETFESEIAERLSGAQPRFVMDHDALGHFEDRFGVPALAAVSDGEAARPGPRRVESVRRAARDGEATCLLVEAGQGGRPAIDDIHVVEIDPLGLTFAAGPELYYDVLASITETLVQCTMGSVD